MRKSKTCKESVCESRKIAMPDEINPHGTLFGGVMMSWIDKIGYMCAQNYAEWKKTVTANIDQIQFLAPVNAGDHVTFKAVVTHVGRSSMEIEVISFKENPVDKSKVLVAKSNMTFVAVDENGKGKLVPQLILENDVDRLANSNARLRIEARINLLERLKQNNLESFNEEDLPFEGRNNVSKIINNAEKLNIYIRNRFKIKILPILKSR
jgi:uncharacterized protein (TIGR00369 family)